VLKNLSIASFSESTCADLDRCAGAPLSTGVASTRSTGGGGNVVSTVSHPYASVSIASMIAYADDRCRLLAVIVICVHVSARTGQHVCHRDGRIGTERDGY
jgi:hypothetical protein